MEKFDEKSFNKGLVSMSRQIECMIKLCEEKQKKHPTIITNEFILRAIKAVLILK